MLMTKLFLLTLTALVKWIKGNIWLLERDVWKVKQNSEDNLDNKMRLFTIHGS